MARDFAAELRAARDAEDWDAHARIWEERRVGSVEADEASLDDEYQPGDQVTYRGELAEVDSRYENSGDYLILCADGLYRQANPLALSRPAGSPDQTSERSELVGGVQSPGTAPLMRANTPAGGVVVTQGDRNHAVRLLEDGGQDWQAKEIRIGDGDHFPIVQAFAAHRIASQAALLSALEGLLDSIGEADPRDGYCENSIHIDEVTAARAAIAAARSEVGK